MAETTIEWADYTFNPWQGCTKVAPGCEHCYAQRLVERYKGDGVWGPRGVRIVTSDANWRKPLAWNRYATDPVASAMRSDFPRRPRVFCASLADVFEDWSGPMVDHNGKELWYEPDEGGRCQVVTMAHVRERLFELIDATPHLDWLLLTKRPENIRRMTPAISVRSQQQADDRNERGDLYRPNVWLLTSASDQATADAMIPELLKCRDLAPVLGVSCEPLLGPIDLLRQPRPGESTDWLTGEREDASGKRMGPAIDWVIAGGESGPKARPMHPDWARGLRDQCDAAGVPYLFKQWGEWKPALAELMESGHHFGSWHANPTEFVEACLCDECTHRMNRVGKKNAGRMLNGVTHDGFPQDRPLTPPASP